MMMFKVFAWFCLVVTLCSILFGPAAHVGAAPRLVSLWSIKVDSKNTIGKLWNGMPSYQYTCASTWYQEPGLPLQNKVLFWPNFMGPDTLVSPDTTCWLTASKGSSYRIDFLMSLKGGLYREITSNYYEYFRGSNLVKTGQIPSYARGLMGLVCKSNEVGIVTPDVSGQGVEKRLYKVLYRPESAIGKYIVMYTEVSRDTVCTTNVVTINKWRRNPYWTDLSRQFN